MLSSAVTLHAIWRRSLQANWRNSGPLDMRNTSRLELRRCSGLLRKQLIDFLRQSSLLGAQRRRIQHVPVASDHDRQRRLLQGKALDGLFDFYGSASTSAIRPLTPNQVRITLSF